MQTEALLTIIRNAFSEGALHLVDPVVSNASGRALTLAHASDVRLRALLVAPEAKPQPLVEGALLQLLSFYLLDEGRLSSAIDYGSLIEGHARYVQPTEVSFEITKLCNLSCLHCYNDSGRRDPTELGDDEKVSLAVYLARWGVRRLSITGGEPTLDPSFPRFIATAREYGMTIKVTTNGWKLPHPMLEAIQAGAAMQVTVSLDGADAATHDAFRGRAGSYSRALDSIRILSECRPRILQLNASIHTGSVHQMDDLARLAAKFQFDALSFKPVTSGGRPDGRTDFFLSPTNLALFRGKRAELAAKYAGQLHIEGNILCGKAPQSALDPIKCNAAERSMLILSNGAVTPCAALKVDAVAPNVRDVSPMQVWLDHPLFNNFRDMKRTTAGAFRGCPGVRFADFLGSPDKAASQSVL
jgi:AdoMet-dependent heme synthase